MNNSFDVVSQEHPTNQDIVVNYTPDAQMVKYTYRVYNGTTLVDSGRVVGGKSSRLFMKETGTYVIKVEGKDKFDRTITAESGKYIIDKEAPKLQVGEPVITMKPTDKLNVMGGVKAKDNIDGVITSSVTSNIDNIDFTKVGTQNLVYSVTDSAGNTTTKAVILNIQNHNITSLFVLQASILSIILSAIIVLLLYQKSLKLEKRLGKFSVEPLVDKTPSIFDRVINFYQFMVKTIGVGVRKSVFLTRYSKRFTKYLLFNDKYKSEIDIVSAKFLISIIFLIIAIISKAAQYKILGLYEMCFPMLLGFFVLDIIYALQYNLYREKLENDLLQAIIIMNNAFKSGRSIAQAIELVGDELGGIIGEQFKKMRGELSNGLSIEDVFSRFAERVNIEEVTYLTASLSILNKTGGNIIKVFSSIENSLFLKKKLKLELKSLTGSSKIIMWVLFLVPILFIIIISMLSPGYFMPFFMKSVGVIIMVIMLVYYVLYIVVVRKILKVRM